MIPKRLLFLLVLLSVCLFALVAQAESPSQPEDPRKPGMVGTWTRSDFVGGGAPFRGHTGTVVVQPSSYDDPTAPFKDWEKLRLKRLAMAVEESLENIEFEFDSSVVDDPRASELLEQAALMLRNNPEISIDLAGHTDLVGTDGYNEALGLRRALAVQAELVTRGVDPARLQIQSFGEGVPLILTEEKERKNRRVEVVPYWE